MISSCCTLRLKRRKAFSRDSPSWMTTSATRNSPPVVSMMLPWETAPEPVGIQVINRDPYVRAVLAEPALQVKQSLAAHARASPKGKILLEYLPHVADARCHRYSAGRRPGRAVVAAHA